MVCFRFVPEKVEPRTIEGPGGLKLVVSVEKGSDLPPPSIEASTSDVFDEEDGDSVQSMALDDRSFTSFDAIFLENFGVYDVYGGGRGVIGALANAVSAFTVLL